MLDDTCYFIGFERLVFAQIAHYLLNLLPVQQLLKSIIFSDAKRAINKDILMRIDLGKAYKQADLEEAQQAIDGLLIEDWIAFGECLKKNGS